MQIRAPPYLQISQEIRSKTTGITSDILADALTV